MERWRRYRHPKVYQSEPLVRPSKRAWRLPIQVWMLGLASLVGAGFLWFLFGSSFFQIKIVTIGGEATPAASKVLHTELVGKNLILIREPKIFTDLLATDPSLEELHLTRGFPDEVQVTLTRRHPLLVWKSGEVTWGIDAEGVAFPPDPTTLERVPVVIDQRHQTVQAGSALVAPSFVTFVTTAFQEVPTHLGGRIDHSEVDETTFHLRLVTEWGWAILLDTNRPLKGQLTNLDIVLDEERDQIHEYVDLRLPGWAYLK